MSASSSSEYLTANEPSPSVAAWLPEPLTSNFRPGSDPVQLAVNASGAVIATTGVGSSAAQPVHAMGPMVVNPDVEATRFSWAPYPGSGACFTYYKLAYTTDGSPPSYLEGDPYLAALGDQAQSTYLTGDLVSGQTYTFRLQAIRATDTGSFLVAQTEIVSYTAP